LCGGVFGQIPGLFYVFLKWQYFIPITNGIAFTKIHPRKMDTISLTTNAKTYNVRKLHIKKGRAGAKSRGTMEEQTIVQAFIPHPKPTIIHHIQNSTNTKRFILKRI